MSDFFSKDLSQLNGSIGIHFTAKAWTERVVLVRMPEDKKVWEEIARKAKPHVDATLAFIKAYPLK